MTADERLRKAVASIVGMPILPLPEADELLVPLFALVGERDDAVQALNMEREKIRNLKREVAQLREHTNESHTG